ncbi:MAG: acyl--CoA ligase, partial [Xanthobacteraceae bacterium]|nr:acyl--CoA ligase [Xanthobacteraceae bacterium]
MTTDRGVAEMAQVKARFESQALPESLGAFVKSCADLHGDKIVGSWFEDGLTLTYRELDASADRLAASLVAIGVRKGTHVAVMLPNLPAFPLSWIALGRIGAVIVPINTAYTGEEVSFVVEDSDAQFVIVHGAFLDTVRTMPRRPAMLADANIIVHGAAPPDGIRSWEALEREGVLPFEPAHPVARSDLLNLQYTSGTTGFPKGCMLTHDYWVMLAYNAAYFGLKDEVVRNVLIWAPFFYMDPMWQFLLAMSRGGTTFVARRMSLTRFLDWLREYEIHFCIFPEPALKQRPPGPTDKEVHLKYVSIYGWREDARREIEERFCVTAREAYGMTEIGSASVMPSSAAHMAYKRSCGLPAPFRELKIVDERGNTVPPGEVGELWVTGRSLLWGYYKRPEANAESFRGRWFRTGDLFRQDENGYLFLVGRIKDMIRRGGENIAAQEVEAVLRDLPEVEEAAVVPVPDPLRREEVKAYVKLRPGRNPQDVPPEAVFAHCQGRLAKFKIPRYLAYVDDFPRTPSRKIQKKQLIEQSADLRLG